MHRKKLALTLENFSMTIYRCTVCNYLYDEDAKDVKFADLPDSYTCPVCNASKKAFVPLKG